ncbi:hypothetical protein HN51_005035, partial [Arachis hypogaea]
HPVWTLGEALTRVYTNRPIHVNGDIGNSSSEEVPEEEVPEAEEEEEEEDPVEDPGWA